MLKILCAKCKNAYLQKGDNGLVCPSCEAVFPETDENLLSGIQFYNEGEYGKADDCLMKYIVKEGAEPRAIFYKAVCDATHFDEETTSLTDTYEKLYQSLTEIDDQWFVDYLRVANDDLAKLEQAIAEMHIRKLVDADAEGIKKQVSIIIALQNEAADFRKKLTEIADEYNTRAEAKISVKFSPCCFVNGEIATEVGDLKFNKITESIASHTVFTGILSTDIKNLEIYYRCIVMFFCKNREKYDFLMSSAEKFNQLAKTLEEGNYTSIKGTTTIGDRLKAAAYDFFQESLKDEDEDEEQQTETIVIHEPETLEIEASAEENEEVTDTATSTEEMVFEDVYSNSELDTHPAVDDSADDFEDISSDSSAETEQDEPAEENPEEETASQEDVENTEEAEADDEQTEISADDDTSIIDEEEIIEIEEVEIEDTVIEEVEIEQAEDASDNNDDSDSENTAIQDTTDDEQAEATEAEPEKEQETTKGDGTLVFQKVDAESFIEDDDDDEDISSTIALDISDKTEATEKKDSAKATPKTPDFPKGKRKRKKNYGPLVALLLIVIIIGGIVAIKVLPPKILENKYSQATQLEKDEKFMEAAEIYDELENYEDSKTRACVCKFQYASLLEKEEKYTEAAEVYKTLGEYSNSDEKVTYCTYKSALALLDSGKYDDAIKIFETIRDYKDSASQIKECTYQKALKKIEDGDFVSAVSVLESLGKYKSSTKKILEAKLSYVKANMDPNNETTLTYVNDLVDAKYPDDIEYIRKELLNPSAESTTETTEAAEEAAETTEKVTEANAGSKKIKSYVNYSSSDKKTTLKEADSGKAIYFHVEVNDPELYGKEFKISYKTSLNYENPPSTITFSENSNSFELPYTGDSSKNYTVEFNLYDESGNSVASQTVTIK